MKPIFNMLSQTGKTDLVDGRIRPTFLLNGTVTGRISSCIRKGTKIEVVRDVSKYPNGINIEDVKPGDLVYCYDKNCKPTIEKVLDKVYKGKKELLRIHWIGSGRKSKGYLDCTPDHKIRLTTGEYIRADKLKAGDSVLAMSGDKRIVYLKPNILKVEKLNIEDDVYDLVIQGTHNFIANGICVHNCNPNLQQIPRSDTYEKKQIKCMYAAEPNKKRCLLQADFCANEIRFWGLVSEDHNLCKAFNDSFKKGQEFRDNPTDEKLAEEAHLLGDIHKQTAAMMFDIDVRKVDKGLRQQSKGLSLGIMYQRGTYSVAQQMGVKFEEAQEKVDKFNAKFPEGVQWAEEMKKFVLKHGYVESPIGRRRHLNEDIAKGKALVEKSKEYPRNSAKGKELFKKGNGFIARAQRQSVNSPIQGVANDVAMVSSAMLNEYIATNDLDWLIVNTVHDSVVVELPQDDLMLAAKVIRNLFTKKNKEYFEKHFPNWKWKTHVDIDFEVSQGKAKICKKCGKQYMFGLKKCECGCEDYKVKELNHGYGTIIGWDETKKQLKIISKGF